MWIFITATLVAIAIISILVTQGVALTAAVGSAVVALAIVGGGLILTYYGQQKVLVAVIKGVGRWLGMPVEITNGHRGWLKIQPLHEGGSLMKLIILDGIAVIGNLSIGIMAILWMGAVILIYWYLTDPMDFWKSIAQFKQEYHTFQL